MKVIKVDVATEASALALALLAEADHYQNLRRQVTALPKDYYWETMAAAIGAWIGRELGL